jgi:glycyl-tRNA synthetase
MVKDPKSGEILRADHLAEQVLEMRLKGNKEARMQTHAQKDDPKNKKKMQGVIEAVKLEDAVVQEYEEVLAKVAHDISLQT